MQIPSTIEAEAILTESQSLNPGPWVAHSHFVAQAARTIAFEHPDLDDQIAYILGILHDIGRRAGVSGMRHVIDGFNFLQSLGYDDAARICLTHSYPIKVAASGFGGWDGSPSELQFVQDYLDRIDYSRYDRLIQLCDSIALPTGFCLMEKRLVDVVMRYGFNEYALPKWKAYFEIKTEFDQAIGRSVYSLLPGIVENTFEMDQANRDQGY
jgi:HD domain